MNQSEQSQETISTQETQGDQQMEQQQQQKQLKDNTSENNEQQQSYQVMDVADEQLNATDSHMSSASSSSSSSSAGSSSTCSSSSSSSSRASSLIMVGAEECFAADKLCASKQATCDLLSGTHSLPAPSTSQTAAIETTLLAMRDTLEQRKSSLPVSAERAMKLVNDESNADNIAQLQSHQTNENEDGNETITTSSQQQEQKQESIAEQKEQLKKDKLIETIFTLRTENLHLTRTLELSQQLAAERLEELRALQRQKCDLTQQWAMSKFELERELEQVRHQNRILRAQLDALTATSTTSDSIKYPSLGEFKQQAITGNNDKQQVSLDDEQREQLAKLDARLLGTEAHVEHVEPSAPTPSMFGSLMNTALPSQHQPSGHVKFAPTVTTTTSSRQRQSENSMQEQMMKQIDNQLRQRLAQRSSSFHSKGAASEAATQRELIRLQQQLAMYRKDYYAERHAKLDLLGQLEALRVTVEQVTGTTTAAAAAATHDKHSRRKRHLASSGTRHQHRRHHINDDDIVELDDDAHVNVGATIRTERPVQLQKVSRLHEDTFTEQVVDVATPTTGEQPVHKQHVSRRELKHAARAARQAARDYHKQQAKLAHHRRHHSHHRRNPIAEANNLSLDELLNGGATHTGDSDTGGTSPTSSPHMSARRRNRRHHHHRHHGAHQLAANGVRVARDLFVVAEPFVQDILSSANKALAEGARLAGQHMVGAIDRMAERANASAEQQQQHSEWPHYGLNNHSNNRNLETVFERNAIRVASCVSRLLNRAGAIGADDNAIGGASRQSQHIGTPSH